LHAKEEFLKHPARRAGCFLVSSVLVFYCFIFKRESEMEAEQSEGLHFRKSAETTGQQTFIFKRVSEMEAEQSEGLHFRTSAENTGSIPRSLLRN